MNIKVKTQNIATDFTIPCKENHIKKLCQILDIANDSHAVVKVESVYMDERANNLFKDKVFPIDKLNYLAKRMDSFDKDELTTFYAVAYGEKIDNIDALVNLTFNTHCATVIDGFSDLESTGKKMYLTEQVGVTLEELNALDGTRYFKERMEGNDTLSVTPYGIIYKNRNAYTQVYDGRHFPQYTWGPNMGTVTISKDGFDEFLYFPFEDTELKKALERLDVQSMLECDIELESEYLTDKILSAIVEGEPIHDKLMQLSAFTKKYEALGPSEKDYLNDIVECLNPHSEKDIISIVDSLYEFEFFNGVHNAQDYGRYMICESGHFEYDENLEEYIDFERYGNHRIKLETGSFIDDAGYLLYHGYNRNLAEMLKEVGINIEERESQKLKFYMPLKGITYYDENEYGDLYQAEFEIEIHPEELVQYEYEILEALENNYLPEEKERGLMEYYGDNDSVNAKIKYYEFSVEVVNGELMGVVIADLNAPLDEYEMSIFKQTVSGQASDGFGEGFEQREIRCNGKDIYVSFWQSENWTLQTAEELGLVSPKQELKMGSL